MWEFLQLPKYQGDKTVKPYYVLIPCVKFLHRVHFCGIPAFSRRQRMIDGRAGTTMDGTASLLLHLSTPPDRWCRSADPVGVQRHLIFFEEGRKNRPAEPIRLKKNMERKNTQDDKSNASTKSPPMPSILGRFRNLRWVNLFSACGDPSY